MRPPSCSVTSPNSTRPITPLSRCSSCQVCYPDAGWLPLRLTWPPARHVTSRADRDGRRRRLSSTQRQRCSGRLSSGRDSSSWAPLESAKAYRRTSWHWLTVCHLQEQRVRTVLSITPLPEPALPRRWLGSERSRSCASRNYRMTDLGPCRVCRTDTQCDQQHRSIADRARP